MNPRLIAVMIFVLVTVALVPLVLRLRKGAKPQPVALTTMDLGEGRAIRMTVEPNSQGTLSLHYHITVNDEPKIDHAFFGTLPRTSPPPGFVLHSDIDGGLVGVAQASAPNRIVILHDFENGRSWPRRTVTYKDNDPNHLYPYYEDEDTILSRGDAIFSQLAEANPDQSLELLRTMGMRPLTLPGAQTTTSDDP